MKFKLIKKGNPAKPSAPKKWYPSAVNAGVMCLCEKLFWLTTNLKRRPVMQSYSKKMNGLSVLKLFVIAMGIVIVLSVASCKKDCNLHFDNKDHKEGEWRIVGNDKNCYFEKITQPEQICPGCGMPHGQCKPGCNHGTNCICHDTIPGTNKFNTIITITNTDELNAVIVTNAVNNDLANNDCESVRVNATGLKNIPMENYDFARIMNDLGMLVSWNDLASYGTGDYSKLTVNMPDKQTTNVYPARQDVRVQDPNWFMSQMTSLQDYFKFASQTVQKYFSVNSITDTINAYRFVPDTVKMSRYGNLVENNNYYNLNALQGLMNIPNKTFVVDYLNPNDPPMPSVASLYILDEIQYWHWGYTCDMTDAAITNGSEYNQNNLTQQKKLKPTLPLRIVYVTGNDMDLEKAHILKACIPGINSYSNFAYTSGVNMPQSGYNINVTNPDMQFCKHNGRNVISFRSMVHARIGVESRPGAMYSSNVTFTGSGYYLYVDPELEDAGLTNIQEVQNAIQTNTYKMTIQNPSTITIITKDTVDKWTANGTWLITQKVK